MRKSLVTITIFLLLGTALSAKKITICHYNVGAFHKSEITSEAYVASMMKELQPDAVLMNELDSCNARSAGADQLRAFCAEMGGWDSTFSAAIPYAGGSYGIGISSNPRLKKLKAFTVKLPKLDGGEQRVLCVVEYKHVILCATHLDHKSKTARLAQAQTITSWISEHYDNSSKAVILCGDFNAMPDSETVRELQKHWDMISDSKLFTFPSHSPDRTIDYIFSFKGAAPCKVLKTCVPAQFKSGTTALASDHMPVFAKIEILK